MDRLFSLSASNREDVLEWCKFLKSSGGGEWKNEFIYRINRYEDFLRSARRCMKMEVGVVYNAILPEGRTKVDGIDCDALESDDRLAALLVLVEILKFAIEVDEWLLAVIVLEHFNKTELREFVVHMFQPEFHKSSAIFFRFPDNTAAPQGGFCDLSVRMFERFWRVFHDLLPLVVDKLSNTRSTLEDIYQRFLQEEDIVSACLIWTSSAVKARERWGTVEHLSKNLFRRYASS